MLLPLPADGVMTTPPSRFGVKRFHSEVPGSPGVGSYLAPLPSKYSRLEPPAQDIRIIQLLDMRLVATISTPLYVWW